MTTTTRKSVQLLACTIGLCTLSACGWVDSTGAQVNENPTTAVLRNAQPLVMTESTALTAELIGEGSSLKAWTWTADNKNEIYRCTGIDGFDLDNAVTTLSEACTTPTECSVSISESDSISGTQFTLTLPELKSPLALSYSVSTVRDDGAMVSRQQLLCGISINEAPMAMDDSYIVRQNNVLVVDAESADSLLSNDTDDTDFRNAQLQVILEPVTAPQHAAVFTIDTRGGFTYQAMNDAPVNSSGYTQDSFSYAVTDGIHIVNATVDIKIVNTNEPPVQLQQIPDAVFTAANGIDDSHIRQIDLSQYFTDADGDPLSYQSSDVDSTIGLSLSAQGILLADASILDVRQWRATVQVNDGIESAEGTFVITIRLPDTIKHTGTNAQPGVTDIKNRRFTGTFSYNVSRFFVDPDRDDQLTFTARGLPVGIQIRADGVIEGSADASNLGTAFIQVTAEDGYGGTVSDGFNLILD